MLNSIGAFYFLMSYYIQELGKKFIRPYVWSIALYGSKTRTRSRSIWRASKYSAGGEWKRENGHISNEEVLDRRGGRKKLLNNILQRIVNWIDHILRRNCLLHDTIDEQMTKLKGVGIRTSQLFNDF